MDWRTELLSNPPDPEVARRVAAAVEALLAADAFLFEADVNERSISHKLAVHLAAEFPEWDVDCEYNRDGFDPKRLHLSKKTLLSDDTEATTVYPDIIIHQRGGRASLIAIEIKKTTGGSCNGDREKLRALQRELSYQSGLFLRFRTGAPGAITECEWVSPTPPE